MARYYFHLHECGTVIPDEEGLQIDYACCNSARAAAPEHALRPQSTDG
jgi:hypothetical protein